MSHNVYHTLADSVLFQELYWWRKILKILNIKLEHSKATYYTKLKVQSNF